MSWQSQHRGHCIGYSLRWPAASDQSSLTPTATHYVESHDLPWPIRGQYSYQSEASIPANQRLKDVTKRADGGKLLCIKKRVLMELLFLSKYNFDHCIFCDLNKCSRVYWDLTQIEARQQISPFHRSGLRGPSFSLAVGLKCKCKADWDKASCLLREVQLSAWVMIKWWHWCCPVATKQHAERGPASCRLRSGQSPACWEGSSSQPGVISDNVRTLSQTGCQYKACILLMIFQLRTGKYIW